MKKIICLVLALSFVFMLAAGGGSAPASTAAPAAAAPADAPAELPADESFVSADWNINGEDATLAVRVAK